MSSPGPKVAPKKGVGRGRGRAGALQAPVKVRGESLRKEPLQTSPEGALSFARVQTLEHALEAEL